jgi:hypothetical protein
MPDNSPAEIAFLKQELSAAYRARAAGRLGLARVCARRAAGWAIRAVLRGRGVELGTPSAFEHIRALAQDPGTAPHIRTTLGYFQERVVKPNGEEDSFWPHPEIDLVQEAHWLIEELLGIRLDVEA